MQKLHPIEAKRIEKYPLASFAATVFLCDEANKNGGIIVAEILGKDRYFIPNLNPHDVYDFANDKIGVYDMLGVDV